jgi:hypothetical protein
MPFIWTLERPLAARFVRIQLLERTYLHLEQVEIFGEDQVAGITDEQLLEADGRYQDT